MKLAPAPKIEAPTRPEGWRNAIVRRTPIEVKRHGYAPFRCQVVDGIPRVIGPDGKPSDFLEFFAQEHYAEVPSRKVAVRDVSCVLAVCNTCYDEFPDVIERLITGKEEWRRVAKRYFQLCNLTVVAAEGKNAGIRVEGDTPTEAYNASITVFALTRLCDRWFDAGIYVGDNAMKMDPTKSRLAGGKTKSLEAGEDGELRADTDRYFRVTGVGRRAPRSNDPFFLEKVMQAGADFGWHPAVSACVLAKGKTGGRDFQVRPATLYQWIVLGREQYISVKNKWKRDRKRIRLRVPMALRKVLEELIDATYPGGMKEARKLAKTMEGRRKLMTMPIFTINGVKEIGYTYLNDHNFRPAIERAGLKVLDWSDETEGPIERWVTMHWLRHEFVNTILDRIEESALGDQQKVAQQLMLARYMGWKSGEAMLRYYGAWHFNRQTDLMIAAHQEAANDNATPSFLAQYDDYGFTAADRDEVRRVAGSLVRFG